MNIAKGSLTTFSTQIFVIILQMMTGIITAHKLGPEGRGILLGVNAYPQLFYTIVYLSLNVAFIYHFQKKQHNVSEFVGTALFYGGAIGVLSIFAFYISYIFWGVKIYGNASFSLLLLNFLWLPLLLIITYFSSILQAMGKINEMNLSTIIGRILGVFFVIFLVVVIQLGVLGVVITNVLSYFVSAGVLVYFLHKIAPIATWSINFVLLKKLLSDALKMHVGSVAVFLYTKINSLIVYKYLSENEAGWYSVAAAVAEMLFFVPLAVQTVLFPRTGQEENELRAEETVMRVTRHTFYISVIGGLFLALLSKYAILIYGGKRFLPALPTLLIMLPGIIAQAIPVTFSVLWVRKGYFILTTIISIINAIFNISAALFLIPRLGISGAALATTITYIINMFIYLGILKFSTQQKVRDVFAITKDDIAYYRTIIDRLKA